MFSIRMQNDDVQDFDVRRDQALLSASGMLSDVILEGMYKSNLQDSVQFQTVLALYDQGSVRNNGGKEICPSQGIIPNVNLMSVVLARPKSGKYHVRRLCTKRGAPAEWRAFWRNMCASSRMRTKYVVLSPVEAMVTPTPTSTSPEERKFVVNSGASMHMVSKKRLKLR